MSRLGSGENGEFTFLDTLSILSFIIGLQNLDLNLTQEDMDRATKELDAKVNEKLTLALSEIHGHLRTQDDKIDLILSKLEVDYDKNKEAR